MGNFVSKMTMTPKNSFAECLDDSIFIRKLLNAVLPIYIRNMKSFSEDNTIDFNKYGNAKEKYLKSIMSAVGGLQRYFVDLEQVVKFLKVDKSKISAMYDHTIEVDDYFKYHYDNFIIRVVTSIDVCGKIGNLVYNLGIAEKKANWYSFANHALTKGTDASKQLFLFSSFLESLKTIRHTKVHSGHNPENRFDEIIFWEVIDKFTKSAKNSDSVYLNEYTLEKLSVVIAEIENFIFEVAKHALAFLDAMVPRLNEIIEN